MKIRLVVSEISLLQTIVKKDDDDDDDNDNDERRGKKVTEALHKPAG